MANKETVTYAGRLLNLSTNQIDHKMRTQAITGEFINYPVVGKSFIIVGKSLNPAKHYRMVRTAKVNGINTFPYDGVIVFTTEKGRKYRLEVKLEG